MQTGRQADRKADITSSRAGSRQLGNSWSYKSRKKDAVIVSQQLLPSDTVINAEERDERAAIRQNLGKIVTVLL